MQNFSPRNCRPVFRALLLLGVLAGLLFSCGEGIRLFPFPPAEAAQTANFKWDSSGSVGYQKNVPRFETRQETPSKSQRKTPAHQWAGGFSSPTNSPALTLAAAAALKPDRPFSFPAAKSTEIIESRGSRAPPVSKSL